MKMDRITLTVNEVSEILGVSTTTIYQMVRENEIPHKKVRSRILFHKPTIESWLASELTGGGEVDENKCS